MISQLLPCHTNNIFIVKGSLYLRLKLLYILTVLLDLSLKDLLFLVKLVELYLQSEYGDKTHNYNHNYCYLNKNIRFCHSSTSFLFKFPYPAPCLSAGVNMITRIEEKPTYRKQNIF